ncbi:hypothetical protein KUF73_31225, partial [Pseudomonas sp. PD9R]
MADNRTAGLMVAGPLYLCHGGEHTFTIKAEDDSPWTNQGVSLNRNPAEPALPVTSRPAIADFQKFDVVKGASWAINSPPQSANAEVTAFQLWAQTEFTSAPYQV